MLQSVAAMKEKNRAPWRSDSPAWDIGKELYPDANRFYFLFKQGMNRTNVCHAELISLLQMHVSLPDGRRSESFQFISESEFDEFVEERFSIREDIDDEEWLAISNSIQRFVELRIVYEAFETGAVVYIPQGASVDLGDITAFGGYIHSCGDLVFSWNSQIIDENLAAGSIFECLNNLAADERAMLVPYCHEDFTSRDRNESEFLKDGLDNVKLNIAKSFIGETPLHNFVNKFVATHKDKIVAAPANYKKSKDQFSAVFPDKKMVTIWIVADNMIVDRTHETYGKRNLISYRQRFKNDNPYHHYEENKPAWVSHTTLPHSLAGAMINLARPWLPSSSPVICDPFCGSGTIYLEAQKFNRIRCYTSDKSPLAERILQDNIAIFRLSSDELSAVIDALDGVDEKSFSVPPRIAGAVSGGRHRNFERVLRLIEEWSAECGDDFLQLSKDAVSKGFDIIGDDLVSKIVLYVALRTNVRGQVAMMREGSDWFDIFKRELSDLLLQMRNHLKSISNTPPENGLISVGSGQYSAVMVTPQPYEERADLFGTGYFDIMSVEDLPRGKFDAVICDPPYGFNTTTERWFAEEFANKMIPAIVEALKSEGQIVVASPRTSFSGRKIPLALRSDYITRSILEYCSRTGRQCWKPSVVLPEPIGNKMGPPYYWRAEKTLNRMILQFWIRPA